MFFYLSHHMINFLGIACYCLLCACYRKLDTQQAVKKHDEQLDKATKSVSLAFSQKKASEFSGLAAYDSTC